MRDSDILEFHPVLAPTVRLMFIRLIIILPEF